jgi:hypothetical protein
MLDILEDEKSKLPTLSYSLSFEDGIAGENFDEAQKQLWAKMKEKAMRKRQRKPKIRALELAEKKREEDLFCEKLREERKQLCAIVKERQKENSLQEILPSSY